MKQIECKNITAGYDGVPVINNLSFMINSGGYYCIHGENGAGKTTLMKVILGLHPLMFGSITKDRCVSIGYVPQRAAIQDSFPATVKEIIMSGNLRNGALKQFYNKEDKRRAQEYMALLNIDGSAKFSRLSGGQRQKTLLARALCTIDAANNTKKEGRVLLLDEPTAGLDADSTESLYKTIAELNRQQGVTIMMITHDKAIIEKHAGSSILIKGKRQL